MTAVRRLIQTAIAVALAATALAHARTARAEDTSDIEGMLEQSVVTTASHMAETNATTPGTTSVITAEDIRRHGIRSLNEAINFLGLGLFTTNPSHGGEIGGRGVLMTADYGNHVLLLIDGHAVNEPYGGSASFDRGLGVPIELVDHIEVVLGPGAVLYGSNAVLGVVNVVTKRVRDHHGLHLVLDSELLTWGKAGVGGGASVNLLGRRFDVTTQVEHWVQDGPAYTFAPQDYGNDSVTGTPKRFTASGEGTGIWGGTVRNAHYARSPSAYLKVVSGDLEIAFRGSLYHRASPYQDGLVNPYGNFDDRSNYELERWAFTDVKYRIPLSSRVDLFTRAYADAYTYDWYLSSAAAEDCAEGQTEGCRRNLRALSRWMGLETRTTIDWLKTRALVTMVGADTRYERVSANNIVSPNAFVGPRETTSQLEVGNVRLGVYGQQTANPTSWLALNAGARLDVAEGYPGALSPRAAAAVTPYEGGTLKAVYSEAFRAPSSYEREFQDTTELKAQNLKPEEVRSVEGAFEQRFGPHRLMFGVFNSQLTNLVSLVSLTPDEIAAAQASGANFSGDYIAQYRNAGHIDSRGYNAAVEGTVARKFRYGLHLTGAYARRQDPGSEHTPLTVMPALYGNARASYDLGDKLPTLALAAQFAGRRFVDRAFDASFTPIPTAPPTLELRGALTGDVPGVHGLTYRATVNYAFQPTGPYVIGPIQEGSSGAPPTLNPVDRFRVGVGLQYTWDP